MEKNSSHVSISTITLFSSGLGRRRAASKVEEEEEGGGGRGEGGGRRRRRWGGGGRWLWWLQGKVHCKLSGNLSVGAVMYLFRGTFGITLYTGDFRWEVTSEIAQMEKTMLLDALKNDKIDTLYLENTYCNPSYSFPSRELAAQQVVNIRRTQNHVPLCKSAAGCWRSIVRNSESLLVHGSHMQRFFKADVGNEAFMNSIMQDEWQRLNADLGKVSLVDKHDAWRWTADKEGIFSVKSIKSMLSNKDNVQNSGKLKWRGDWRAMMDRIPTALALNRRGVYLDDNVCALCNSETESTMHLFTSCWFTTELWVMIGNWCRLDPIFAFDFQDLMDIYKSAGGNILVKSMVDL
ncbi:hypothetical protein M8C21_019896 [Ambrosia artemisiifolia]|uniref:Reverse transcriptase zinc-binding domain-containing protein n=1 Tax=Ambrosia artemisiifolia TaxID=4212 RepID=A0AAD5G7M6_AMBAR|nr:hypothetical protein M8C21_019896 [Ambrosia artemisiifolia]